MIQFGAQGSLQLDITQIIIIGIPQNYQLESPAWIFCRTALIAYPAFPQMSTHTFFPGAIILQLCGPLTAQTLSG